MIPSPQQSEIYEWIRTGNGNALIVAVAGAGKTTTLIEGVALMRGTVALAAYNKKIATEIQDRLERSHLDNARASTFHAFGFGAWRRIARTAKVKGWKITDLCQSMNIPVEYHEFIVQAVSLARQSCIGVTSSLDSPAAWQAIIDHHDLTQHLGAKRRSSWSTGEDETTREDPPDLDSAIAFSISVLKESIETATSIIDFDDMIYMPLYKNLRVDQYDWVLIDEAQDSNPARRALARKMLAPGGRLIAVGDPAQAIYGFTGADSDSLDIIKAEFGCIELPLTVSYRCPIEVTKIAQRYLPEIQWHESAPHGTALDADYLEYFGETLDRTQFTADTAILCRNTKPLIQIAYRLIKADIPCHVEGRDIGRSLVKLASRWPKLQNLQLLGDKITEYRDSEIRKLMTQKKEGQAAALEDRCDALLAIIEGMPVESRGEDLRKKITDLFADSEPGSTKDCTLSTIHKSKGREWHTVFWLCPSRYQPSKYARQAWQQKQEINLMYVACTRAKDTLITINETGKPTQPAPTMGSDK